MFTEAQLVSFQQHSEAIGNATEKNATKVREDYSNWVKEEGLTQNDIDEIIAELIEREA